MLNSGLIPVWSFFVFCIGLCVGSFLNVCIWRLPRDESIVFPSSHCPKCGHEIAWFENIPLISWLCLRGRCRKCSETISPRYFIVELLTGILFCGVWFRTLSFFNSFHLTFNTFIGLLLAGMILTAFAVMTAFIDYEHFIIPNKITYPVLIYGLTAAPVFPGLWPLAHGNRWMAFALACASVTLCGGILALLAVAGKIIFKKDALGWGDVKYIAALAAVLGPFASLFTMLIASISGSVAGIWLIVSKKKKLHSPVPFGVFMALGTYLWIILGTEALQAYFRFSKQIAAKLTGN